MVLPGTYIAGVFFLRLQQAVETGSQGRTDAEIRIPEPADVVVRVVDHNFESPVRVQHFHWQCVWPPESRGGGGVVLDHWNEDRQRFEFRAPAGPLKIYCRDDYFIQVSPQIHEVPVGVERDRPPSAASLSHHPSIRMQRSTPDVPRRRWRLGDFRSPQ